MLDSEFGFETTMLLKIAPFLVYLIEIIINKASPFYLKVDSVLLHLSRTDNNLTPQA